MAEHFEVAIDTDLVDAEAYGSGGVKSWHRRVLGANGIVAGTCGGGGCFGITLVGADNRPFAHGHFSPDGAADFVAKINRAYATYCAGLAERKRTAN